MIDILEKIKNSDLTGVPGDGWFKIFSVLYSDAEFKNTLQTLKMEYEQYSQKVFPNREDIFNCFRYTAFEDIKCVIVGQDPYPKLGQAHGLCFSSLDKPLPSLRNIYEEIYRDLGIVEPPDSGDLTKWARRGVLLLNSVLTYRKETDVPIKKGDIKNAHAREGTPSFCNWEAITDNIIKAIAELKDNVVFILWGGFARKKKAIIDVANTHKTGNTQHRILEGDHPSPCSVNHGGNFFGNNYFSETNEYLSNCGKETIDWNLN